MKDSGTKPANRGVFRLGVVLTVLASGVAGCANFVSLAQRRVVNVESVSSEVARIWWVDVRTNYQRVWVTGEVIRHKERLDRAPGHMDIEVLSPNPDRLPMLIVSAGLEPTSPRSYSGRVLGFVSCIGERILPGSTFRVVHDAENISHDVSAKRVPVGADCERPEASG